MCIILINISIYYYNLYIIYIYMIVYIHIYAQIIFIIYHPVRVRVTFIKLWYVCVSLSVVSNTVTPWTVACQAPLSVEFSRQGYWIGLLFPSPGDLPNPGTEHRSPTLQANSLPSAPPGTMYVCVCVCVYTYIWLGTSACPLICKL